MSDTSESNNQSSGGSVSQSKSQSTSQGSSQGTTFGEGYGQTNTSSYIPNFEPQLGFLNQFGNVAGQLGANQYGWAQDQFANTSDLTEGNVNQYLEGADMASSAASRDYANYNDTYNPAISSLTGDWQSYTSPERVKSEMGRSEANVGQNFEAQRANSAKELQAFGINPSDPRYAGAMASSRTAQAAAQAGAGTQARLATEATGRELRGQALQQANLLPGQQATEQNLAMQGYTGAENAALSNVSTGALTMGTAPNYLNAGIADVKFQPLGTVSGAYNQNDNAQQNSSQQSAQSTSTSNSVSSQQSSGNSDSQKQPAQQKDPSGGGGGKGPGGGGGGPAGSPGSGPGGGGGPGSPGGSDGTDGGNDPYGPGTGPGNDGTGDGWDPSGNPWTDEPGGGIYPTGDQPSGPDWTDDPGGDTYPSTAPSPDTPWVGADNSALPGQDYPMPQAPGQDAGLYPNLKYIDEIQNWETGGNMQAATGGAIPDDMSPSRGQRTDDVPAQINQTGGKAQLNAGEFVIPRDVVEDLGQSHFRNLIMKSRKARGAMQQPIGPTFSGGAQHHAYGGPALPTMWNYRNGSAQGPFRPQQQPYYAPRQGGTYYRPGWSNVANTPPPAPPSYPRPNFPTQPRPTVQAPPRAHPPTLPPGTQSGGLGSADPVMTSQPDQPAPAPAPYAGQPVTGTVTGGGGYPPGGGAVSVPRTMTGSAQLRQPVTGGLTAPSGGGAIPDAYDASAGPAHQPGGYYQGGGGGGYSRWVNPGDPGYGVGAA